MLFSRSFPENDPRTGQGSASRDFRVSAATAAPVITSQPADQTVPVGGAAEFTAAATGTPAPSFQWQVSTNNGSIWSNLAGQTGTTLRLTNVQASMNNNRYRVVVSNSAGTINSRAALLTVSASSISASNTAPNFGSHPVGYAERPTQTITITNTGNQNVTLNALPNVSNWTLTPDNNWATAMAPGATRSFTIRPNHGLAVGNHDRSFNIIGTNGASVQISPMFTVTAATHTLSVSATAWQAPSFQGGVYQQVEDISRSITVTTNQPSWNATSSQNWLRVSQSGQELILTAEMNLDTSQRTASVGVTAGNAPPVNITIVQSAWQTPSPVIFVPGLERLGVINHIPYRFHNPIQPGLTIPNTTRIAWNSAASDWNTVPGINFVYQSNAQNNLYSLFLPQYEYYGRMESQGWTTTHPPIIFPRFNAFINLGVPGSTGVNAWRSIANHEFGHAFGLYHYGPGALMYTSRNRHTLYRPTIHDIHGVRTIMGLR